MDAIASQNLLVFQDGPGFSYRDKPYQSGERAGTVVQSFRTELTEPVIREQL